jgi:hypothetical protein
MYAECATSTLHSFLLDRSLSGLLGEIAPNPVSGTGGVRVSYRLTEPATVTLEVIDVMGRVTQTIARGVAQPAGSYTITFDAHDLSNGSYVLRFSDGERVSSRRFVVEK